MHACRSGADARAPDVEEVHCWGSGWNVFQGCRKLLGSQGLSVVPLNLMRTPAAVSSSAPRICCAAAMRCGRRSGGGSRRKTHHRRGDKAGDQTGREPFAVAPAVHLGSGEDGQAVVAGAARARAHQVVVEDDGVMRALGPIFGPGPCTGVASGASDAHQSRVRAHRSGSVLIRGSKSQAGSSKGSPRGVSRIGSTVGRVLAVPSIAGSQQRRPRSRPPAYAPSVLAAAGA
jgi:hypothetical protein